MKKLPVLKFDDLEIRLFILDTTTGVKSVTSSAISTSTENQNIKEYLQTVFDMFNNTNNILVLYVNSDDPILKELSTMILRNEIDELIVAYCLDSDNPIIEYIQDNCTEMDSPCGYGCLNCWYSSDVDYPNTYVSCYRYKGDTTEIHN